MLTRQTQQAVCSLTYCGLVICLGSLEASGAIGTTHMEEVTLEHTLRCQQHCKCSEINLTVPGPVPADRKYLMGLCCHSSSLLVAGVGRCRQTRRRARGGKAFRTHVHVAFLPLFAWRGNITNIPSMVFSLPCKPRTIFLIPSSLSPSPVKARPLHSPPSSRVPW